MERDILTMILFIITVVIALLARRRFKRTGKGGMAVLEPAGSPLCL